MPVAQRQSRSQPGARGEVAFKTTHRHNSPCLCVSEGGGQSVRDVEDEDEAQRRGRSAQLAASTGAPGLKTDIDPGPGLGSGLEEDEAPGSTVELHGLHQHSSR